MQLNIVNLLKSSLKDLESNIDTENVNNVGEYLTHLSKLKNLIENKLSVYKELFKEFKTTVFFPNLGEKVVYQQGKDKTRIDSRALANHLVINNRINDLLNTISITEKSINSLEDAAVLIAQFKEKIGVTDSSVKVSKMTKEELKEHQAPLK